MSLFDIYKSNTFEYTCDRSPAKLREEIVALGKRPMLDFSTNLAGEMTDETRFIIYKRFTSFYARGGSAKNVLHGKITSDVTPCAVKLRPQANAAILLMIPCFLLAGGYVLCQTLIAPPENPIEFLIIGFVFAVIVPAIGLFYGQHSKMEVLNDFVKEFDLKRI